MTTRAIALALVLCPHASALAQMPEPVVEGRVLRVAQPDLPDLEIALSCDADNAIRVGTEVYLRCPPNTVVRASITDGQAASYVLEEEVRALTLVDGEVFVVEARGPVPFADAVRPLGFPDPRLDQILERARALDERGDDEEALALIESTAATPVCPPYRWDMETASAARDGLSHLENPDDQSDFVRGGGVVIGLGAAGLVATLITSIWLVASNSCGWGCHSGYDFPDEPVAAAAGISLGVAVIGMILMVGGAANLFSPTARAFEERRHRLRQVTGDAASQRGPTEVFSAFGAEDCRDAGSLRNP